MLTVAVILLVLTLLYLYGTRTFNYWAKRGVKHENPIPFLGNTLRVFLQFLTPTDHFHELYYKHNYERFFGYYMVHRPTLVLRDPELIKNVIATDFNHFYSRGVLPGNDYHETVLNNLFFADGDMWKCLRQRMTPAFTSGKLKAMFPLIIEKTDGLKSFAETAAKTGKEIDVRDLMARYTTDFIGAVGFGIDSQSMDDENSQFRKVGKRIFSVSLRDNFIGFMKVIFPAFTQRFNFFDPMIEENITSILRAVVKQRGNKPSGRNDFIDQLMELRQKGKMEVESIENVNPDGTPKTFAIELDEQLMVGQMFIFFAAGFETSSSATSYTLHQLAFNPDCQRKCQEEIDEVLSRYNNKLCYEAVMEMKYLDLVFKEGIRMWPSLGILQRRCERPYRLPGTDVTIDRDVDIVVPVYSLQNDEQYFPEPDKFIPERFLPENKQHHKFSYLPFGDGPRACIGERLGRMQSLAGLAALLSRFSVEPSERSVRKPRPDPTSSAVQSVLGGVPLRIVERKLE